MLFIKPATIIVVFILLTTNLWAQGQQVQRQQPDSSIPLTIVQKVQQLAKEQAIEGSKKFQATLQAKKQEELIEMLRITNLKARDYVKARLDTVGINKEIREIAALYAIAGDGVITNKGSAQTYRNLTTSYKIFYELHNRALARKIQVDNYQKNLRNFRFQVDSLTADSLLYNFPADSAELVRYSQRYSYIARDMSQADSALNQAIINTEELQAKANALVYRLKEVLEEIESFQQELAGKIFKREFPNIWGQVGYDRPVVEIIHFSFVKARLSLWFYIIDNPGKIAIFLLLIGIAGFFLSSLKKKLQALNRLNNDPDGQLVFRYPVLSAILIITSIFQFIFPAPPFVFSCILWLVACFCLSLIFRHFISAYWMRFWKLSTGLFILAVADNLVLQASRTERWAMLLLALAGIGTGVFFLVRSRNKQTREKLIIYFIILMVLMEAVSVVTNIYGRYNLSKTLLIGGYLGVINGILFLWTIRLINEGLLYASETYKSPEKKSLYLNFNRVGNSAPSLLNVLLVVGWFILLARNFYAFRRISAPLTRFFVEDRNIGNFSFSISSVLLFFLIIALSVITSKIVSFFASDPHQRQGNEAKERKSGVGSWLLLVRVFIITAGLLLALAAAGFPMDRITIILGALGVGVGLGLQTLVNSLVSGLVIAFEKPVNVGDIIEFGGQTGTMKSIGFRSSVITTWEGADVVVPNGDLLNSHLVNWTLAGNKRRFEITVGVAYGSDIEKAQKAIHEVLKNEERISPYPAPGALLQDFGASAINLKVLFWVKNIKEGAHLKSDLMLAIDTAFRKNNIVIPLPQQDLYIHTEMKPANLPGKEAK